jgi:hypothetical protein
MLEEASRSAAWWIWVIVGCLLISLQFQLQGERHIKKLLKNTFHEPFLSIFDFTPAIQLHDVRVPEKPSATLH